LLEIKVIAKTSTFPNHWVTLRVLLFQTIGLPCEFYFSKPLGYLASSTFPNHRLTLRVLLFQTISLPFEFYFSKPSAYLSSSTFPNHWVILRVLLFQTIGLPFEFYFSKPLAYLASSTFPNHWVTLRVLFFQTIGLPFEFYFSNHQLTFRVKEVSLMRMFEGEQMIACSIGRDLPRQLADCHVSTVGQLYTLVGQVQFLNKIYLYDYSACVFIVHVGTPFLSTPI